MRRTNISFVGNRKSVYSLGSLQPPLKTFFGDELYLYSIGDYATNTLAIIIPQWRETSLVTLKVTFRHEQRLNSLKGVYISYLLFLYP